MTTRRTPMLALTVTAAAMLALLPAPAAPPQPANVAPVTFHTSPEGAKVFILRSGREKVEGREDEGYLHAIGLSGQPVLMDTALFDEGTGRLNVRFKLDEHEPVDVIIDRDVLTSGRYPPHGSTQLAPTTLRARLRDLLTAYGIVIGFGLALIAGGAVTLVLRERARRAAVERAERLEGLEGLGATASDDAGVGAKLGRYRLVDRLGKGGMATVYRGLPDDTLDEREAVAVKVLTATGGSVDDAFRARFRREVRVSNKMSHPNIVRVIDWGADEPLYIVMELLKGQTLTDRWRKASDKLSPSACVRLLRPLFDAVQYAHDQGVVHRDLKPDNIMITENGTLKVMDFGIARTHDATMALTADGNTLGTPDYMAPEQVEGFPEEASDQYALGVITYELLCGRRPHEPAELMSLLLARVTKNAIALTEFAPELGRIEMALMRMLEIKPADRYGSVREAFDALAQAVG